MSDKYNWLEDLPTNPPKPGDTSTRNTLQPAVPNYGYPAVDYTPKKGDFILTPLTPIGTRARIEMVGGTFFAEFNSVQGALEYLSRLEQSQGVKFETWQVLNNGHLSPMRTHL